MIRDLKILVSAAMALAALGAISASGAQAAEFHCSLVECRLTTKTDGTGKTAHHLFLVENKSTTESASFTCESLTGHARVGTKTTEVTLTNIKYDECNVNGSAPITVDMNECTYLFTASGEVHLLCPTGQKIELTVPGGCIFTIGALRATGISYATVGSPPNREVTVSVKHVTIPEVGKNPPCAELINVGQDLIGTYTTGNTLVTGETETGEVMADAWFE